MRTIHFVTSILLAATAASGAYAADQAKSQSPQVQSAETAAIKDVGKLSKAGGQAFQDVHQARLAIFNADPDEAKSMIGKAVTEIEKAKSDEAVYRKAEAKLDAKLNQAAAAQPDHKNATDDPTKEVAWLPVDGQLGLGENFVATPEKTEAMKKANENIHKGDRNGAIETLRLAGIDVKFTMAVVPLDKTVADIQKASQMIDGGQYYEANALLKGTEGRVRFDTIDVVGTPVATQSSSAQTPSGKASAQSATTAGAQANAQMQANQKPAASADATPSK